MNKVLILWGKMKISILLLLAIFAVPAISHGAPSNTQTLRATFVNPENPNEQEIVTIVVVDNEQLALQKIDEFEAQSANDHIVPETFLDESLEKTPKRSSFQKLRNAVRGWFAVRQNRRIVYTVVRGGMNGFATYEGLSLALVPFIPTTIRSATVFTSIAPAVLNWFNEPIKTFMNRGNMFWGFTKQLVILSGLYNLVYTSILVVSENLHGMSATHPYLGFWLTAWEVFKHAGLTVVGQGSISYGTKALEDKLVANDPINKPIYDEFQQIAGTFASGLMAAAIVADATHFVVQGINMQWTTLGALGVSGLASVVISRDIFFEKAQNNIKKFIFRIFEPRQCTDLFTAW